MASSSARTRLGLHWPKTFVGVAEGRLRLVSSTQMARHRLLPSSEFSTSSCHPLSPGTRGPDVGGHEGCIFGVHRADTACKRPSSPLFSNEDRRSLASSSAASRRVRQGPSTTRSQTVACLPIDVADITLLWLARNFCSSFGPSTCTCGGSFVAARADPRPGTAEEPGPVEL